MRYKKNIMRFVTMLVLSLTVIANISLLAFAEQADMDGVGSTTSASTGNTGNTGNANTGGNGDIGNYLEGYNPVDGADMQKAQQFTSPLANAIGMLTGCIVTLTSVLMFAITALDLLYIAVPFTRPLLTSKWQLVSDEAIKTTGGGTSNGGMQGGMNNSGFGAMGGMQGGMGAMGGMNGAMGAMGAMGGMNGANSGQTSGGSVILTYFKNRVVFMIFFAVATVLLLSSLFTGCGVNLARLLARLVSRFSG